MTALSATFQVGRHGNFDSITCLLPDGSTVSLTGRKCPLYDLARELDQRGYGDHRLQAYTPKGTPSLWGKVSVMAGLTVEETDNGGLRLRKYRPFPVGGRPQDAQISPEGTHHPLREHRLPAARAAIPINTPGVA